MCESAVGILCNARRMAIIQDMQRDIEVLKHDMNRIKSLHKENPEHSMYEKTEVREEDLLEQYRQQVVFQKRKIKELLIENEKLEMCIADLKSIILK